MTRIFKIDAYDLHDIVITEMYEFFREVGPDWISDIKDTDDWFMRLRFLLPANRINKRIEEHQKQPFVDPWNI